MIKYSISFYPGIIMPEPYIVEVDEPTTDYQALLDILADRLSAEGCDGLFDDDYEQPDDMIVICGNESRRLITGGMLSISEVKEK